jgi:uncharacterized SAM-binding protein YcdF (DUF218 family)
MLSPALCQESSAGQWATFTWQLFERLTKPELVLPAILGLILLPWFVRSLPRKRVISSMGLLLLLLYSSICSPLGIRAGNKLLVSLLPTDSGQPADAIVVLGRGSELRPQRIQVATDLWRTQRAPLVFASGWGDAEEMATLLTQQGLPATAIDGEPCSRTTEENALFTAAQLQPKGVRQILLVTDPPHMLRSYLTFRSLGFEVLPHANPLPPELEGSRKAFLLVREYLGLVSYSMLGRFAPRQAPTTALVPAAAAASITPASFHALGSNFELAGSSGSPNSASEPAKSAVFGSEQLPD